MMTTRATIGERSRFRVRFPGAFTSAAKDADEARAGRGAVVRVCAHTRTATPSCRGRAPFVPLAAVRVCSVAA